jgi:hypothetical protein
MKKYFYQFKNVAVSFLIVLATIVASKAQDVKSDSLHNARTDGTQSIIGTVTYDGTGAGTVGAEGTFIGYNSGRVTTGIKNSFFGANSGYSNTTGFSNTFIGSYSGYTNSTGSSNVFVGYNGGYANTTGSNNTFIGNLSGKSNTTGAWNAFLGLNSGYNNSSGASNVFVGVNAGFNNTTGQKNVFLGSGAGYDNVIGTGNVFLGKSAGGKELGSNKLYIANSDTLKPLIYGDFASKRLELNGKVGINTSTFPTTVGTANVSTYGLFVKGGILADEVRVRTGWADYVFDEAYDLKSLADIEFFITKNGHLPNVPTAAQVESDGLSLGDISRIQQEKIEELTLHLINQNKLNEKQQSEIDELKKLVKVLVEISR